MPEDFDGWKVLHQLGSSGQADVYVARSPEDHSRLTHAVEFFLAIVKNQTPPTVTPEAMQGGSAMEAFKKNSLPGIIRDLARDDRPQWGALKRFKLGTDAASQEQATQRLAEEERALREYPHPSIVKLLHSNVQKAFIVSEFHPGGTLAANHDRFKGKAVEAMTALLPIVEALRPLHKAGVVHRDIKPENIFVANDGRLVLGDFGIVYQDGDGARVTRTHERVASHHWAPPWQNLKKRLDDVPHSCDTFALGKVLWCMIAGEEELPYWYHDRPDYNLEDRFPDDPAMAVVNGILGQCVVEHERDCFFSNAELLFGGLYVALRRLGSGVVLREGEGFPCRVCGLGKCLPTGEAIGVPSANLDVVLRHPNRIQGDARLLAQTYICTNCGHVEFFKHDPDAFGRAWLSKRA